VRCPRCGNENPATNRFCGSCGASLLSEPPSAERNDKATQVTGVGNSAATTTSTQRAAASVSRDVPAITGPSFLGLNTPPPSGSRSIPNLRRDSHHGPPSGNLDYLLDDDDEPRSSTGKIFLILIALALALGFGYLRWRHEGLSSLWSSAKKPAAAQTETPPSVTDAPVNAPDTSSSTSTPGAAAPNTGQPTGAPSQPAAAGTDSSTSAGTPAATQPPLSTTAPSATTENPANAASPSPSTTASAPPADKPAGADSSSAPAPEESSPAAAPTPKPATKPRPAPKPTPAKTFDQVTEAEKYIYGRGGARQDCDRGLRMLRPAAEQSNPRAMISLGALYSTGVCAPRDLPTAYRWFALALRKQPDNQPLQENLQRLWAQMTQPERQLAVKLSQ
jgi:hypothetical protein